MKSWGFQSLKTKILLIQVLVLVSALAPSSVIEFIKARERVESDFSLQNESFATSFAEGLRLPLWNFSDNEVNDLLNHGRSYQNVARVALLSSKNQLVTEKFNDKYGTFHLLESKSVVIVHNNKELGRVEIEFSRDQLVSQIHSMLVAVIVRNSLAIFVAILLTTSVLQISVIRRIYRLVVEAKKLGLRDLESPFHWREGDELDTLAKELNNTRQLLKDTFLNLENSNKELVTLTGNLEKIVDEKSAQVVHASRMATLGEMSAGVAHEINNPLAIIASGIPLLAKFKENPEKFSNKVESMLRAVGRIEKIVSGLKKFSRISSSAQFFLEDPEDILKEALPLVESKMKTNLVDLRVNVVNKHKILCDRIEIEQIFINLINNSVDAIAHLPERWIEFQFSVLENEVLISVSDSGWGVPVDVEQKLFQPFFTTKPIGEGTGLGLSIAKGIMDSHRGSIRLNNTSRHTCFELRFPRVNDIQKVA